MDNRVTFRKKVAGLMSLLYPYAEAFTRQDAPILMEEVNETDFHVLCMMLDDTDETGPIARYRKAKKSARVSKPVLIVLEPEVKKVPPLCLISLPDLMKMVHSYRDADNG